MNTIVTGRGEIGDIGRVNGFPWLTNSRPGLGPSYSDQTLFLNKQTNCFVLHLTSYVLERSKMFIFSKAPPVIIE